MTYERTTRTNQAAQSGAANAVVRVAPAHRAHFLIDTLAIRNHPNWLKTNDRDLS